MLDDILKAIGHGHRKHGHWDGGHGHRDHRHGHHLGTRLLLDAAQGVLRRPGLLMVLAALGVALLALGVWLLVALLSHAGPALDFAAKNGLKGVVEAALGIARRLWEGAGGR